MSAIVPLPKNVELITEFDAIVIRRAWRSKAAYFLAFFSAFWNVFMVVWMTIALKQGELGMAAFGSIHASVGLFLLYFTIASFVNKTDVRINTENLQVSHGPIPWFGNKSIPVHEISQLYCEQKVTQGKNGQSISYRVNCLDHKQRKQKLLSGLNEYDQARYIEAEIEKILGIKNVAVEGEF